MNSILGTGICASGVVKALIDRKQDFRVFGSKDKKKHIRIRSNFRPSPVISNEGFGGLTSFYHGVSPGWLLDDPVFRELTGLHLCGAHSGYEDSEFYFVQNKIIRSCVKRNDVLPMSEFNDSDMDKIYLCASVLGNLSYISSMIDLEEVTVSDDIVIRLGAISNQVFEEKFTHAVQRFNKFVVFPSVYENSIMYSFRPVFKKSIDINFIDILENFRDLKLDSLIEKFRSSMFLRFGLALGKPIKWEVYAQINIKECYLYRDNMFTEVSDLESKLHGRMNSGLSYLDSVFPSFKESLGSPISGIHLGYDREILNGLSDQYVVLDTSLNTQLGLHPTMIAYLQSYKLAAHLSDTI